MEILIFNEPGSLSRSYTQTIKGEVFVYLFVRLHVR